MPTTPKFAIPYPVGTDPADVPTDLNKLATRIDTIGGGTNGLATLGATGKVPIGQIPVMDDTTLPGRLDGAGTTGNRVADCNLAVESGWYASVGGSANLPVAPSGGQDFDLFVIAYGTNYAQQTAYQLYSDRVWRRYIAGGAWTAWVQTPPSIFYSATPPASPGDGDLWYLPVADGYIWQFRFRAAATSTYKWEFIGGAPWSVLTAIGGAITSITYVDLPSPAALTIPRAGEYLFRWGAALYNATTTGSVYLAINTSAAAAADGLTANIGNPAVINVVSVAREWQSSALTAGSVAKLMGRVSGGQGQIAQGYFSVQPLRVI